MSHSLEDSILDQTEDENAEVRHLNLQKNSKESKSDLNRSENASEKEPNSPKLRKMNTNQIKKQSEKN